MRALQAMLALYGYGVEITGVYDRQTRQVVTAFQRHFRPERVDGEADASTVRDAEGADRRAWGARCLHRLDLLGQYTYIILLNL